MEKTKKDVPAEVTEIKAKIQAVMDKVLPETFNKKVWVSEPLFKNDWWVNIMASPGTYLINGVEGQLPEIVSLRLSCDTMELQPQIFGGNGGQSFSRRIRPDLFPREKFLAQSRVKVPFRKPQPNEKAVLSAVERFFKNYIELLKEWKDDLRFKDKGDYSFLND